jgi:site-specific recombinase XerD
MDWISPKRILTALSRSQATPTDSRSRRCSSPVRPLQLRHAHAIEMAHEGVPLVVIQSQLGHPNLGITSIYLQGIDSSEIIATVHSRPAPVISASAGLIVR